MTEPHALPLNAVADRIAAGELAPSELLDSCLHRIAEREPVVQAWETLDAENACATARSRDTEPPVGPLHGVPVGVKDIIDVAGLPTRCGSVLRGHAPAGADARIVQRLRAAGAVVLGKTVTTELAYFTPGKTRNPHDPGRTPGGSSSGSAAAVADRMVPLAIGSQTAASTSRPAAYCGTAALVTTPGRWHDPGITGLSPTLDSLGLFTRSTDELALAAAALLDLQPPQPGVPALRWCDGAQFGDLESAMGDAVTAAVETLRRAGARVDELPLPDRARRLGALHRTVMAVEAARSLAAEAATGRLSATLQALLDEGATTPEAAYRAALEEAAAQRETMLALLDGYQAVLAPAATGVAPQGAATGSPDMSRPWQVLGLPSVTVPGLRDAAGLPLGVQLVGRPGAEAQLLAVARWVEARLRGR